MLTVKQVAAQAGCSRQYVARQCQQGVLKAQRVGNAWVIDRKDADKWLASMKRKGV